MDFAWIHYGMHFVAPLAIAYLYDKEHVLRSYIILMLTMLIDVDHLMATPIFEANRCSINFHPLHQYWAIAIYIILLIPQKTRLVAIGLCFHILTDYLDCYF
jgi:hypothetical protein